MTSLASYHPFMNRPTYKALADAPLAERVTRMRQPEIRAQILGEQDEITGGLGSMMGVMLGNAVGRLFSLSFPVDYEPDPSQSIKARARALGIEPLELLYDEMTAGDGTTFFALLGNNFHEGTLEPCREMLLDPNTVSGLSDAGAHVMMISDCSASTFHLTHWVRDRSKGERVPLELAVHKLTGAPADMYGFADRGTVTEGKKADLNVIDLERLTIQAPTTRSDLPTGASRILQPSTGYLATIANGEVVRRDDADTGARPGYLLRSGQAAR
jgi:N-acyl-D-aspartate/D-glutamate deacylase